MSAPACPNCGRPTYPGGRFCGFCAAPLPGGDAVPGAAAGATASAPSANALDQLADTLGLGSGRTFEMRGEGSQFHPRYVVYEGGKNPLFTFEGAPHLPRFQAQIGRGVRVQSNDQGQLHTSRLVPSGGGTAATLAVQHIGADGEASLFDPSETAILNAQTERHGFGGFRLSSTFADGTPYLSGEGKVKSGQPEFRDRNGAVVARLRFPTLSTHEAVHVDILGGSASIGPLVLAFFVRHLEP